MAAGKMDRRTYRRTGGPLKTNVRTKAVNFRISPHHGLPVNSPVKIFSPVKHGEMRFSSRIAKVFQNAVNYLMIQQEKYMKLQINSEISCHM